MSEKKEVKAVPSGDRPAHKKQINYIKLATKALRKKKRDRLIRKIVDPVGYEKTKKINMLMHEVRNKRAHHKKEFHRILRKPHLLKGPGKKPRRYRSISIYPALLGRASSKAKRLFREVMPILELSKKKEPRNPKFFNPAPHLNIRNPTQYLEAERRLDEWVKSQEEKNVLERKERSKENKKKYNEEHAAKKSAKPEKKPKKTGEKAEAKVEGGEKAEAKVEGGEKKKTKKVVSPSLKRLKRPSKLKVPKLKKTITPGTILIKLSNPHAGRRSVFLKRLPSGALLCAGPKKINGAYLHRLTQSRVIATSTKIDISGVKLANLREKQLFRRNKRKRGAQSHSKVFFGDKKKKEEGVALLPIKVATKVIDEQLVPLIKKVPFLSKYLRAKFSLGFGAKPHLLKF